MRLTGRLANSTRRSEPAPSGHADSTPTRPRARAPRPLQAQRWRCEASAKLRGDAGSLVQVVTFDDLGASGHPNHISTHYGALAWHTRSSAACDLYFLVRTRALRCIVAGRAVVCARTCYALSVCRALHHISAQQLHSATFGRIFLPACRRARCGYAWSPPHGAPPATCAARLLHSAAVTERLPASLRITRWQRLTRRAPPPRSGPSRWSSSTSARSCFRSSCSPAACASSAA